MLADTAAGWKPQRWLNFSSGTHIVTAPYQGLLGTRGGTCLFGRHAVARSVRAWEVGAMIRAVFFDVGETLVDETRQWGLWADWLGVSRLTFFAAFGAVIARGEHHRRVFDHFAPGLDVERATSERAEAGDHYRIERLDFYPDALPCLAGLRQQGLRVGIAGNQPEAAEHSLRSCGILADYIASSARWGVEKPSRRFFERIVEETGLAASEIAYVGDRLDNDVLPAREAGMMAIFIERGPWGILHAQRPEAARAAARLRSLAELPSVLNRCGPPLASALRSVDVPSKPT